MIRMISETLETEIKTPLDYLTDGLQLHIQTSKEAGYLADALFALCTGAVISSYAADYATQQSQLSHDLTAYFSCVAGAAMGLRVAIGSSIRHYNRIINRLTQFQDKQSKD